MHRPDPTYLAQLHESLDAQSGVTWEWAIQIDGGRSLMRRVPGDIRADGRVTLDNNGRWFGQAVTRNLALARVKHPLLQTVDADDLLLPGALAVAARALTADAELALAFGRTLRLRPDGARVPGKNPYPPGRLEPGRLARDWHRRGGSCPIVVGSVMWRTACVDAQGGWPALVAGMDVLLLCVWQVPLQRAVSTPIRTSTAATARRCIAARSASRCGRTIARSCAACWRLAARRHPRRAEVSRRLLRRPVEHLP